MAATETSSSSNTSLFYRLFFDKELRSVTIQVITMALIFAFFFFIVNNAITNLETIGKGYSFSFLWDASNYDINQTLIEYDSRSPHWKAAIVGMGYPPVAGFTYCSFTPCQSSTGPFL